jgi:hypothetical protein
MCAVRPGEVCLRLRQTALNTRGAVVSAFWNEPEILANHARCITHAKGNPSAPYMSIPGIDERFTACCAAVGVQRIEIRHEPRLYAARLHWSDGSVVWLPKVPEFEGLKASAVGVALTLFPLFPQMREKNVGRFAPVTSTVTIWFTPTAAGNPEQSDDVLPPAEYVTVMDPAAIPTTAFCWATAWATSVAELVPPPQISCQLPVWLLGSPVMPEIEMVLVAASAPASAERCASSLAK